MITEKQFTVLYIEDNEASRKLLEFITTRREEVSLIFADSGKSGLDMAMARHPDLILVDLTLPDINGYDVLDKLRATPDTADIPVVAVSGDIPTSDQEYTNFEFDKYLPKPIELQPYYDTLDAFLKT